MMKTIKGQKVDTVFTLILFCVFAASVLLVLVLGGSIYKNTADISKKSYSEHTGLSYIWTKVKNGDKSGGVQVKDFNGLSALCLVEEYDGTEYHTLIYLHEGWIYELFYEAGLDFYPEDGTRIIKSDEPLTFEEVETGLIRVFSDSKSLLIFPRSRTGISFGEGRGLN